jgi:hypothetical protein
MLFNFFSDEKIKKIPALAGTVLFGKRDYIYTSISMPVCIWATLSPSTSCSIS